MTYKLEKRGSSMKHTTPVGPEQKVQNVKSQEMKERKERSINKVDRKCSVGDVKS